MQQAEESKENASEGFVDHKRLERLAGKTNGVHPSPLLGSQRANDDGIGVGVKQTCRQTEIRRHLLQALIVVEGYEGNDDETGPVQPTDGIFIDGVHAGEFFHRFRNGEPVGQEQVQKCEHEINHGYYLHHPSAFFPVKIYFFDEFQIGEATARRQQSQRKENVKQHNVTLHVQIDLEGAEQSPSPYSPLPIIPNRHANVNC